VTQRLYRDDPYLLEFDAVVVARRTHQGKPAVVLDRTAFYAESGGQPWDTGTLAGVAVVAVVEDGDDVLHVLGGALGVDDVHGRVDAERRRDHRQQHHGQHLLSRAFVELASARTVSFHLGMDTSSVDLDRDLRAEQVRAAEQRTNEIVWEARPVTVRTLTRTAAETLGVLVPPEAGDAVRLVEAEGFDLQPCGGTHPRSTAEVGVVVVLGHERYKGGTRVRFVCGHRALAAVSARTLVLDRTGSLVSASFDQLPAVVQKLLDQAAAGERRVRELLESVLEAEARRLFGEAAASPAVVVAAYEGWPATDLRTLAQRLVALGPCVALLGSRADKAHVVFAQSEGLGHDIQHLLRDAVAQLDGRGGGQGNMAQGGGPRLEQLGEALAAAAAAVRAR
jgi:alanyl-tRNA synthetase